MSDANVVAPLTYEREEMMAALCEVARKFCGRGEFVIRRGPFRWRKYPSDEFIPNCYEMFGLEGVCEQTGYEVVHDFGHFAVVRGKP